MRYVELRNKEEPNLKSENERIKRKKRKPRGEEQEEMKERYRVLQSVEGIESGWELISH